MNNSQQSKIGVAFREKIAGALDIHWHKVRNEAKELREVLEYYATGSEWDYGTKAREVLFKYNPESKTYERKLS